MALTTLDIKEPGLNALPPGVERYVVEGGGLTGIQNLPELAGAYDVCGARAGVRTTSKDHFPVVGALDENLYISTAHGSHGILSSLLSAIILSEKIMSKHSIIPNGVYSALSSSRFLE